MSEVTWAKSNVRVENRCPVLMWLREMNVAALPWSVRRAVAGEVSPSSSSPSATGQLAYAAVCMITDVVQFLGRHKLNVMTSNVHD